jgi:hypothetical protein
MIVRMHGKYAVAALLVVLSSPQASSLQAAGPAPRLPDGTPDLGGKGVWYPRRVGDMASTKWKSIPAVTGKSAERDVDVPFLPWARARFDENRNLRDDTEARCLPPGIPRMMFSPYPFEILQQPNRIVFVYEGGAHIWRIVWMDGRPHPPDPNPSWMGDSIGHWEGDTLVIDAVGFNDKTTLDEAGHPHTEQLHVIERYTRTGPLSMKYEVTIEDPGAYARPWSNSATIPFHPGEALMEYICLEGERDLRHIVAGK